MRDCRTDFPMFAATDAPVYLDNAATTQKPQAVLDALNGMPGEDIYARALEAAKKLKEEYGLEAEIIDAAAECLVQIELSNAKGSCSNDFCVYRRYFPNPDPDTGGCATNETGSTSTTNTTPTAESTNTTNSVSSVLRDELRLAWLQTRIKKRIFPLKTCKNHFSSTSRIVTSDEGSSDCVRLQGLPHSENAAWPSPAHHSHGRSCQVSFRPEF